MNVILKKSIIKKIKVFIKYKILFYLKFYYKLNNIKYF